MKKQKFNGRKFIKEMMCKPVEITAYLSRDYDHNGNDTWHSFEMKPRHGWVVGVTWLRTGVTIRGYYDEPNTFEERGPRRLAYLVCPWPTVTPFKVPPENVKLIDPSEFLPYFHTDTEREFMSRDMKKVMKDFPRDEKGRWIKIKK